MATIRAIEAKSVHQIQSGQVIVDLCSVVKELVENSLDAGATAIEVRFKNNGLDAIEVQDNGSGIDAANYENIALKHFTSKLSSYDDLSSLHTFGFRGEALSSLCALSKFSIVTAQVNEAPKGKRLDFDSLGRLKSTTIVAAQKGTTASVENLFDSLPVRRKELSKNIKREYGKVLGQLQAYACIGVNVKFTVKNAMPKAKSMMVFSTRGNATTRENIANVYGAKTLSALASVDLDLSYQPTLTQMARKEKHTNIHVQGHISKPVFGEGRQTPDRQMFFVNGRPCGLPQIAKAINEVYKAFNVSQSPFIFADLQMDTNAYDVNVSPDKRTILIHDSALLIENLKAALDEMFDQHEQTVPQSHPLKPKLPAFQKLHIQAQTISHSPEADDHSAPLLKITNSPPEDQDEDGDASPKASLEGDSTGSAFRRHFENFTSTREEAGLTEQQEGRTQKAQERRAEKVAHQVADHGAKVLEHGVDEYDDLREVQPGDPSADNDHDDEEEESDAPESPANLCAQNFNARIAEAQSKPRDQQSGDDDLTRSIPANTSAVPSSLSGEKGIVPNAFDRMRPKRIPAELATVTIGDQTFTTILGSQFPRSQEKGKGAGEVARESESRTQRKSLATVQFSQTLRKFGAQKSDAAEEEEASVDDEGDSLEIEDDDEAESRDETRNADLDDEDGADEQTTSERDAEDELDADYVDDEEKKRAEEAKVAVLIQAAEASSAVPSKENLKRANKALAGGRTKDATTALLATVNLSIASLASRMRRYDWHSDGDSRVSNPADDAFETQDAEARLTLTVSKPDFARMKIVGQFNLGFILAVRPAHLESENLSKQDELFIIDQHASDEKYNFERLQAETVVGNQRLVRPVILDLTAVEEEIVLENKTALEKNGFLVEMDISGDSMVGQRCSLISLPLSKEVVFGVGDLEELIQLLADSPGFADSGVPRPSKVRKMFAMRACRSSIMIGKTLSQKQMLKVVSHMGTIDKPWNCPHGRPTMRHLCTLDTLQPWREGRGDEQEEHLGLGEALHRYVQDEDS